jgi:hypothetical protein
MLGNLYSERVTGTVLFRRKSSENLQYESEEFGTPPYPAKTAPSEVRNVFECTLLQPPASSLLVWGKQLRELKLHSLLTGRMTFIKALRKIKIAP